MPDLKEYVPGPRLRLTLMGDVLLTIDQAAELAALLRNTERLNRKWVGSAVSADGYINELVHTDVSEAMSLKFLAEDDYTAYRFLAAQSKEAA